MAFRDLAERSNYHCAQMDEAEKRLSNLKPQNYHQSQIEHDIYCDQIGIIFLDGPNGPYKIRKRSYFADRKREFQSHTHQYWFVATLTTAFFLFQIIIGAIQTALGATHSSHILTTIFGVLAAVIGGILAYLKSRGQPNRARQLRNSLRKVVEEIEFMEIQLRNPETRMSAKEALGYVNQLYEDARTNAETNYPDFWSTAGTKATSPVTGGSGTVTAAMKTQNSTASYPLTTQRVSGQYGSTQATANRPPSYHPAPTQPTVASRSGNQPLSSQQPNEPTPASLEPAMPSKGGKPPQVPEPAAYIPGDDRRSHQPPNRAAHIPSQGRKYMNTMM